MDLVLGIDQGGTTTRAAVCDFSGTIRGAGRVAGACHSYNGMETAMQRVREAAEIALQRAGAHAGDVKLIYGGLTGADWLEEYELLRENVSRLGICSEVKITNDSIVAMRGGTEKSYGAIVVAGTGGNCAVRAPDGREFVYGYYTDPELQGGGAISRQALLAIFRNYTGREEGTLLEECILAHYKLRDVDELCKRCYARKLENVPGLAPLVIEAAVAGDAVATRILRRFAKGCAELVLVYLRKFEMIGIEVEVVLSGGVFKGKVGKGNFLTYAIADELRVGAPMAKVVSAQYEPVVGAVLLALEAQKVGMDAAVRDQIQTSAQRFGLLRMP